MRSLNYKALQGKLKTALNNCGLSISSKLASRQRACAEMIEEYVQSKLPDLLPKAIKAEIAKTAKAMGDVQLSDDSNNIYNLDIKTHRVGKWGMPNLTSYKKLRKFYGDSKNKFVIVAIDYDINNKGKFSFLNVVVAPIEHFSWDCMNVQGTLGQIQFANAENLILDRQASRQSWIKKFYETTEAAIDRKIKALEKEALLFEWATN